jgi:hypothetical protein
MFLLKTCIIILLTFQIAQHTARGRGPGRRRGRRCSFIHCRHARRPCQCSSASRAACPHATGRVHSLAETRQENSELLRAVACRGRGRGWLGTTAILQHGDREYICMPRSVPIFGYLDSLGTLANRAS